MKKAVENRVQSVCVEMQNEIKITISCMRSALRAQTSLAFECKHTIGFNPMSVCFDAFLQ